MEMNLKFECDDKQKEQNIEKVVTAALSALSSKRFFIHISQLSDENVDIYSGTCVMKNTIVMKEMSLIDVVNLQKVVDKDILESRRLEGDKQ